MATLTIEKTDIKPPTEKKEFVLISECKTLTWNKERGKKIKLRREELGKFRREIGVDANISYGYLTQLESGTVDAISSEALERLIKALKTNLDLLYPMTTVQY